jgi:uncharacterized membrane protein
MRVASVGHAAFAVTLIGLGVLGLIKGNFAPVCEPVPKDVPAREALAYFCAFISLASGIGVLWQRAAGLAARVLLVCLLLWFLVFRAPVIIHAPPVEVSWEGGAETAVIVAAAWVLYAWFAADWDRRRVGFATGENGVRIARAVYGLAMIPFGLAHLVYVKETATLVPGWLPSHVTWAYLTGCTYIAAGVAMLIGICARLAAALSTWQMGMFTLLVWVPIILVAGPKTEFQWSESILSWALAAAGWVVADSYGGTRWLAIRKR